MGTAVEALVAFLERVALLMADEHDAVIAQPGEAAANGPVVADGAVAMQLDELLEDQIDVVHRLRPLGVPRDEDRLPGGEVAVNLAFEVHQLAANAANFLAAAELAARSGFQTRQQILKLVDVRLERQTIARRHGLILGPQSARH